MEEGENMNIETAKKLDYVINAVNNELNSNLNLKVVWNTNLFGILTANLIRFKNNFPIEKKLTNGYIKEKNLNQNFMPLWHDFINEYNINDAFRLGDFINTIKNNPTTVLNDLINFVNNDKNNISTDNVIYNVELINLSQKFESMLVPKNLTLTPISLLVTSKN